MSKSKQKYYVVWEGKTPGIYTSWDECERQVKGEEGAKYKSFASKEEAELAFQSSPLEYFSKAVRQKVQQMDISALPSDERPRYPSIAVDGACSGNPGKMEYQGVDAATRKPIFHGGPYIGGTNNIGEFLAIVHALALLKQQADACAATDPDKAEQLRHLIIYSDSKTAQSWIRKRTCGTKLAETPQNAILFQLIARAERWLAVNQYSNPILKWETERWGEIPADFGRK